MPCMKNTPKTVTAQRNGTPTPHLDTETGRLFDAKTGRLLFPCRVCGNTGPAFDPYGETVHRECWNAYEAYHAAVEWVDTAEDRVLLWRGRVADGLAEGQAGLSDALGEQARAERAVGAALLHLRAVAAHGGRW